MRHPHHLVPDSPWPLFSSSGALMLVLGVVDGVYFSRMMILAHGGLIIALCAIQWWRDMYKEASLSGAHSKDVQSGTRTGMALFILSEVMLFLSVFWGYFHSSLCPTMEVGGSWPPVGVTPFSPLGVPMLNTTILLTSGLSVTWAHYSIMSGKNTSFKQALLLTSLLGAVFTALQAYEYSSASFTMADSCYGSLFYLATGLHGAHVLVGTTFLTVCLFLTKSYSSARHFSFEASAWYWHFVDVVWLFLYMSVYYWGYE